MAAILCDEVALSQAALWCMHSRLCCRMLRIRYLHLVFCKLDV